jgi:hypothetical protein
MSDNYWMVITGILTKFGHHNEIIVRSDPAFQMRGSVGRRRSV